MGTSVAALGVRAGDTEVLIQFGQIKRGIQPYRLHNLHGVV